MLTIKSRRKEGDKRGAQPLPTNSDADNMSIKLFRIKHMEIKSDKEGLQFWLSERHKHESMRKLVEHYTGAKGNNIQ